MASKNTILIRTDKKFFEEINNMKIKRIDTGKENKLRPVKTSRLTLAITRHPLFPKIKQDIIQADLPWNQKEDK